MKILITGGNGYIGRNLHYYFEKNKNYNVLAPSKHDLNLLDEQLVNNFIERFNPDVIIHTAITGGMRFEEDSYLTLKNNIEMFEILSKSIHLKLGKPIVVFGSGAEFDKRRSIDMFPEELYNSTYPIDPYGLSKSIITKQSLNHVSKIHVLRLFNCFNYDEEPTRFIKKCILNIKENKPIEIHGNMKMDFFYMEDLFTVVDYILKQSVKFHLNLVYKEKYTLRNVADIILDSVGIKKYPIIENNVFKNSYTGDGTKLSLLNLHFIGLKEGIDRTCKKLLDKNYQI